MEQHPYRGLAVVLSFIFPGLGQIYNLEIGKGAGFMCAYVVSWALTCVFIGWLFLLVVWMWSVNDAYQFADRGNTDAVGEKEE